MSKKYYRADLGTEYISAKIIENNAAWFERVYEINVLGKLSFATKEVAKATASKLFKEK